MPKNIYTYFPFHASKGKEKKNKIESKHETDMINMLHCTE